ncbi:MAG TPA: hypothetical protein VE080_02130 [Candidatus Aquicultoraceae bacterium]|nr:hypothetical protein [Candidatus Aquicultoraceae bacterium]
MKRKAAWVLTMISFLVMGSSLPSSAEEAKPLTASEFAQSHGGKNIQELLEVLGKPKEVKEKRDKYAKPGFEPRIYIWHWDDVSKLPVKIVEDHKEGSTPYYVDTIKVRTEGGDIARIHLESKNHFTVP